MPMVSIITPVYNRQNFIAEAIQSVINQTWTDWEMLIIDDGSTDSTVQIVKDFVRTDRRIKLLFRTREPKGAATCRNIGIEHASGDYIIFLDSDDLLRPFALEQRLRAFRIFSDADFLVFQTEKFHGSPENIVGIWREINNKNISTQYIISQYLKGKPIWQTSGPIWKRKSIIQHNIFFDQNTNPWDDVDFNLQALIKGLKYKILFNYPPDVLYRLHNNESLSQHGYTKEQRKNQIYFLKKHYKTLYHYNQHNIFRDDIFDLYKKLLKKNLKSRYWDNTLSLILWKIFKQ